MPIRSLSCPNCGSADPEATGPGRFRCNSCRSQFELQRPPDTNIQVNIATATITGVESRADLVAFRDELAATVLSWERTVEHARQELVAAEGAPDRHYLSMQAFAWEVAAAADADAQLRRRILGLKLVRIGGFVATALLALFATLAFASKSPGIGSLCVFGAALGFAASMARRQDIAEQEAKPRAHPGMKARMDGMATERRALLDALPAKRARVAETISNAEGKIAAVAQELTVAERCLLKWHVRPHEVSLRLGLVE